MSGCGCAQCGREFTGLSAFDRHQDVGYRRPHAEMVRCQDPAGLGMVRNRYGRWGMPGSEENRARLRALAGLLP